MSQQISSLKQTVREERTGRLEEKAGRLEEKAGRLEEKAGRLEAEAELLEFKKQSEFALEKRQQAAKIRIELEEMRAQHDLA